MFDPTKERKNEIDLNIMIAIAGFFIIIFLLTMIIFIFNAVKNEKKNEIEISYNDLNNIINTSQEEDKKTNITDEAQNISNSNMEVSINNDNDNVNMNAYKTEETNPYNVDGAKIINGDLKKGLTIQDKNGNQWVWIEVPFSVTKNANSYDEIEKVLENYIKHDYEGNNLIISRNGGTDTNYEGTGLTDEQYKNKKNKMLDRVKKNGGFYIGKYETGYEPVSEEKIRQGSNNNDEHQTNEKPVIKPNVLPYNWVNCNKAEELSEFLSVGDLNSSILFGIQWDLVLKYLNTKGLKTNFLIEDSSRLGNYKNNGDKTLLKTGNTRYNALLEINDLAGNVWEWTLENSGNVQAPSTARGGGFNIDGLSGTLLYRAKAKINTFSNNIGFRCTLY